MPLFSQRKGIRPDRKPLQRECLDQELRNRLWSALKLTVWDHWSPSNYLDGQTQEAKRIEFIVKLVWMNYFKESIDTIPEFDRDHPQSAYEILRSYFMDGDWWQAYDFLEFVLKNLPEKWKSDLKELANAFLEQESAAYRIVDDEIAEITSEYEVETVEEAIVSSGEHVASHLSRALALMSDRQQPDYRNSIKESVSAVESACQSISGTSKGSLGDCIKKIRSKSGIHPAFEQALLKLYGYTSDSGGIRHSLTEQGEEPTFSDAKFMLVACSAFVNFLWTKASEIGMEVSA